METAIIESQAHRNDWNLLCTLSEFEGDKQKLIDRINSIPINVEVQKYKDCKVGDVIQHRYNEDKTSKVTKIVLNYCTGIKASMLLIFLDNNPSPTNAISQYEHFMRLKQMVTKQNK